MGTGRSQRSTRALFVACECLGGKQMSRRKKGAVASGRGTMCNICGKNCGKGGRLRSHVLHKHAIEYEQYHLCFYDGYKNAVFYEWNDPATSKGKPVLVHVLVRRFV